jgi:hypothetical protein
MGFKFTMAAAKTTGTKNASKNRPHQFHMHSPFWLFTRTPKVTGNTGRMSDMRKGNPMLFFYTK